MQSIAIQQPAVYLPPFDEELARLCSSLAPIMPPETVSFYTQLGVSTSPEHHHSSPNRSPEEQYSEHWTYTLEQQQPHALQGTTAPVVKEEPQEQQQTFPEPQQQTYPEPQQQTFAEMIKEESPSAEEDASTSGEESSSPTRPIQEDPATQYYQLPAYYYDSPSYIPFPMPCGVAQTLPHQQPTQVPQQPAPTPSSLGDSEFPDQTADGLRRSQQINKMKRVRTGFTPSHLQILEEEFFKCNFVRGKQRDDLARKINVTPKAVTIWFQNRRARQRAIDRGECF
eukprot:sb/3467829/